MKTLKLLKTIAVLGIVTACICGLAACSSGGSTTNAVAATVDGTNIMEDTVTHQINRIRISSQKTDDSQWGMYLAAYQMTPESLRTQIIEGFRDRQLIKEHASELGIELDTATVDMQIESVKANFSSDKAWQESLTSAGWTEDEYRQEIEADVLSNQVLEYFQGKVQLTDEDVVEAAKTVVPYMYDGRKRTSHILIAVDDMSNETAKAEARAKAQDILNQINAGTLSFEDAVQQYSDDEGTKQKGGDVGYDTEQLVSEYRQGYSKLEKGQISDLVESQFGFHIIKVTDVYKAPEEITSIDQVPEAYREGVRNAAESIKARNDMTAWLDGLRENANFTMNPMPSGLPYDVDMAKYQEYYDQLAAAQEQSSDESSSSSSSESSSGTSASSDSSASSSSSASSESSSASSDSAASSSGSASSSSSSAAA